MVRTTLPRASDQWFGRGLNISLACHGTFLECDPNTRSNAIVSGSLVEQNHDIGVFVGGSDATLEGVVVRATLPQASDGFFGDGMAACIQDVASSRTPASAECSFSQSHLNVRSRMTTSTRS